MRSIVNFPSEHYHRSSAGAACTFTREKILCPMREEARRAANPGFHIFSASERAKLSGQLEPFIDEAMEYLDQEYVRAMNKDPVGDPPLTFTWVDDCLARDDDDCVAMMLTLVTMAFPTTCPKINGEGNASRIGEFPYSEEAE